MDESQVIYVWVDALTNYATGAGYGYDDERFAKWWPADVHLIGKDITRFHCVIWPAMLMSAGVSLPKTIYGHGFVYFKGQKLSKSRGIVVDPLEAADVFGPSALRYFLMREGTYGRDVDFTWEQFRSRYDSELANDLGNLVSRATAMVGKFLGGRIDRAAVDAAVAGDLPELAESTRGAVIDAMDGFAPQTALAAIWELVRRANAYIEEEKPWVLAKENAERVGSVLFTVLEAIRQVAILVWPVMPSKSEEILEALGLTLSPGSDAFEELLSWGAGWPDTIAIHKPAAVFPKYSDEDLSQSFDISSADGETADETNGGSDRKMLSFDRFKELDLRLARIIDAAKVEGATKLIRMTVDLGGGDQRQIVAGIAEGYSAEELKGKTIVVVANLEPATIRGIESQAMLLAAVGDGGISLVGPDKELLPGTRVS
jgi:methionyl-tRNA synthetase